MINVSCSRHTMQWPLSWTRNITPVIFWKFLLTPCLLMLSADNFCKQFGTKSGLTKHFANVISRRQMWFPQVHGKELNSNILFFLANVASSIFSIHVIPMIYSKCSKIFNTSCLSRRPRQTVQTQIRLLLKKQSDQGLPCLPLGQAFCEYQPW